MLQYSTGARETLLLDDVLIRVYQLRPKSGAGPRRLRHYDDVNDGNRFSLGTERFDHVTPSARRSLAQYFQLFSTNHDLSLRLPFRFPPSSPPLKYPTVASNPAINPTQIASILPA
jgi:hypothetical protein